MTSKKKVKRSGKPLLRIHEAASSRTSDVPKTGSISKVAALISESWCEYYLTGLRKTFKALEMDELSEDSEETEAAYTRWHGEDSEEDENASAETALTKRMFRRAFHPRLADQLSRKLGRKITAWGHKHKDRASVLEACIGEGCVAHPSVGVRYGDRGLEAFALRDIPAGTQLLYEDSLLSMALQADEQSLAESLDISLEAFDELEGLVDVAAMVHCFARHLGRLWSRFATRTEEIKDLMNKAKRKKDRISRDAARILMSSNWFSDEAAMPSNVSKVVCGLQGLYPRDESDNIKLLTQEGFETMTNPKLRTVLLEDLEMISDICGCSERTVFLKFKLNSMAVGALEEQMSASVLSPARGSALFRFGSVFNHGCAPNVIRSTICNTLIISSTKDIKKSEALAISYLPLEEIATDDPTAGLAQYDFYCKCGRNHSQKGADWDVPQVEPKLLEAYAKRDYRHALGIAMTAWYGFVKVINRIHDDSGTAVGDIQICPIGRAREIADALNVTNLVDAVVLSLDESLLFASGHVMRAAALLSITTETQRDSWLQELIETSLKTSSEIACMLYGGDASAMMLRWCLDLSGEFFAPLEETERHLLNNVLRKANTHTH